MEPKTSTEYLGVRLSAWVIGLVLMFGLMALGIWAGLYMIVLNLGVHWEIYGPLIAPPSILVVMSLVSYYGGVKIRQQEYALIYAMLAVSSGMVGGIYPLELFYYFGMAARVSTSWLKLYPDLGRNLVPVFFAPLDIDYNEMLYGGKAVPWNAWMPMLGYMITYHILTYFIFSLTMLLMRKQWIDVERLSFPYAVPAIRMIQDIAAVGKPKEKGWTKARLMVYGMVGSFLFQMIDFPHLVNPSIPGLPMLSNYWVKWGIILGPVFPGLAEAMPNADLGITFGPIYMITAFTFIPAEILISSFFFFFLFRWILAPSFTAVGLLPKTGGWAASALHIARWGDWGILWLGVFAVAFQWRYLKGTLKALTGKSEVSEEGEVTGYRNIWVGLIGSTVLFIGLTVAVGGSVVGAITATGFLLVFNLGMMRMRGEAGYTYPWAMACSMAQSPPQYWVVKGTYPPDFTDGTMTKDYFVNFMTVEITTDKWNSIAGGSSGITTAEGLKILADNKVHPRTGYSAQTVAFLLGTVISPFIGLAVIYAVGSLNVAGLSYYWTSYGSPTVGNPLNYMKPTTATVQGPPWIDVAAGGILVFVLMTLRYTFVWWPLSPIGAIIGLGSGWINYWPWMLLWAWIVKMLAIKVGGTKLYDDKWVPLAAGITFGGLLSYFCMATVGMYLGGGGWFTWGPP